MSGPKRFRLLLFDLGKVILPFDIRIATKQFEKYSYLSSEGIVQKVMGTSLDWSFEKGEIAPEAFYEELRKRIGLSLSYSHFVEIWNDIFSENQKVSQLLRSLKPFYPIAIISNTNVLHFNFVLKKFPIVRDIGHYVLSFEEGIRKPEPKIYERALQRFQVSPREALYVDDKEDFVAAARKLGLCGIPFKNEEALEVELSALELLPE